MGLTLINFQTETLPEFELLMPPTPSRRAEILKLIEGYRRVEALFAEPASTIDPSLSSDGPPAGGRLH